MLNSSINSLAPPLMGDATAALVAHNRKKYRHFFKKTASSYRQLIFFASLMLGLFSFSVSHAQWATFGNGTDGPNPYDITSTLKVDDNRAQVDDYANTSSTQRTATLNSTYQTGTFTAGERVIVIDFSAACGSRNYDLGTIYSVLFVSGKPSAITIDLPSSSGAHVSTGTKTKTQILVIHQYSNVNLDPGGSITCDAYDGHTGGVIAFNVSGTLNFNGGVIDASAKGPDGDAGQTGGAAATWAGTPGIGGAAYSGPPSYVFNMNGQNGQSTHFPYYHYQGMYGTFLGASCTVFTDFLPKAGDGGCGGAHIYGTMPPVPTRSYTYCTPNPSTLVLSFGNAGLPGRGGQGAGAGGGGGGGGGGLAGGSAGYWGTGGNTRTDGLPNSDVKGGDGGKGGRGGGIVYIRANTITAPSTAYTCVTTDGGAGSNTSVNGGNASFGYTDKHNYGGLGGYGGNGGNGGCYTMTNTKIPPGGGGGPGVSGNGADGGQGGNGGDAGPVWIGAHTVSHFSSTYVSAHGGSGGHGSHGTRSGDHDASGFIIDWRTRYGSMGTISPLCGTGCSGASCSGIYTIDTPRLDHSSSYCDLGICSLDDVFRVLSTMQSQTSFGGVTYWYNPASGNPANFVTVDGDWLVAYEFGATSVGGSCGAAGISAITQVWRAHCVSPGPPFGCGLPFWNNIANGVAGTWNSFSHTASWGPLGQYVGGVVTDLTLSTNNTCNFDCPGTGGGGGGGGGGGEGDTTGKPRDGIDYANFQSPSGNNSTPSISTSGFNDVDNSGDPATPIELQKTFADAISIDELHVFPNPTHNSLQITYQYSGTTAPLHVGLTDVNGKQVLNVVLNPVDGSNTDKLDIGRLKAGVYVLDIKDSKGTLLQQLNIVKQ